MRTSGKKTRAREWLRHAFAVGEPGVVDISDSDRELIDRICSEIVRRRLATPALLVLEIHRPFNYVSAQALHFFEPVVSIVTDADGYRAFARFLEQRGSIDHLVARVSAMEAALEAPKGPEAHD
jgi:hypothetical protein